jgi:hypothetical protein
MINDHHALDDADRPWRGAVVAQLVLYPRLAKLGLLRSSQMIALAQIPFTVVQPLGSGDRNSELTEIYYDFEIGSAELCCGAGATSRQLAGHSGITLVVGAGDHVRQSLHDRDV